jgi:hypothetical protein
MSAGGMAVDENAFFVFAPQPQAGREHLFDDGGDRDLRAEIVTGDRDGHTARVRSGCQLAEHRWLERAPPAAVNEQCERRHRVVVLGPEQIEGLALRGAIGEAEFGVARRRAVGRRRALPARENLRMFGHPAAIVVFGFVIDGQHGVVLGWPKRKLPGFAPSANIVIC